MKHALSCDDGQVLLLKQFRTTQLHSPSCYAADKLDMNSLQCMTPMIILPLPYSSRDPELFALTTLGHDWNGPTGPVCW